MKALRDWWPIFLLALVLAVLQAVFWREPDEAWYASSVLIICLALPLYVLAWAVDSVGRSARKRWISGVAKGLLAYAILASSPLLGLPLGRELRRVELESAQRYADDCALRIERYAELHGRYPDDLEALELPPDPPRLIADDGFYLRADRSYRLRFRDPLARDTIHEYLSTSGQWWRRAVRPASLDE